MTQGKLRVYLGAAPGVGKTYRMLEEGQRRLRRGTDVVIAYLEPHDRPLTTEMAAGLEALPTLSVTHRGGTFREMDVDLVLARHPEVALVDELAHTNIPGSMHAKRWQDIQVLLDAGIDVISTLNIQHLESLNDVVERITGVPQRETVPDAVVRAATQIELVDMTAEALRRRMAHGNIYAPAQVDIALQRYFRVGNLTALRELALLWLADNVEGQLDRYRLDNQIDGTWETRERVVVALTGGEEGETLIRRASRIAKRAHGSDLIAVHVLLNDELTAGDPVALAQQRALVESFGGTFHQVTGAEVPDALLTFARGVNATQLVLGASRRGRFAQLFSRGIGVTTVAESGPIDVHLVNHAAASGTRRRWLVPHLPRARVVLALTMTAVVLPLLTLALTPLREQITFASVLLLYLVAIVAVSLVGRMWAAIVAAIISFFLLNYFFTPPIYTWTIADLENLLALVVFLVVALTVSATVNLAVRRTRQAAQARREATALASIARSVLEGSDPLAALLEHLRTTFSLDCVTLLERNEETAEQLARRADALQWKVAAFAGELPSASPADGDGEVAIDSSLSLVMRGEALDAADQRVFEAFAAQAALALRQRRLSAAADAAKPIAEADKLRTALLRAVSHDLRTPLASAKAAVEGLRSTEVVFNEADRDELLATADESLDLLSRLVENLLDMSRLQAGALGVHLEATSVAELAPLAVDQVGGTGLAVPIILDDRLQDAQADPALLERILVNLVSNAVKHSPADSAPTIAAESDGDFVHVRVIDHGKGLSADDRERVFLPFQRTGDTNGEPGIGLGLALSRGLAEAMGGTLDAHDTPGGGLTMALALPVAPTSARGASPTPMVDQS